MIEKLKPCPFCGKEVMLYHLDKNIISAFGIYGIKCVFCDLTMEVMEQKGKEYLIEKWNRRTTNEKLF